jgi:undecaprenyl diphosphate synthase
MTLGLARNYDSQTEIADAAKKLAEKCLEGLLEPAQISPQIFAEHLYTAGWPEVDLLVRTSGEMRISNFLLWQISYAEFYATPTLWPDFSCDDLDKAILAFAQRARRFGDVKPANKEL